MIYIFILKTFPISWNAKIIKQEKKKEWIPLNKLLYMTITSTKMDYRRIKMEECLLNKWLPLNTTLTNNNPSSHKLIEYSESLIK